MPQGAEYEENQVLVSINPSADRAEVEQLLARVPGIVAQQVSDEDMERGLVAASLEPGTSVEDAVNALRGAGSPVVAGSQPNYLYHVADDVEQEVVATQTDETVFANTGDATGSEEPASATVAVEATEGQTSAPEEVLVQDEQQPAEEAQAQGQQTQGGAGEQANAVQEVQTASSVQGRSKRCGTSTSRSVPSRSALPKSPSGSQASSLRWGMSCPAAFTPCCTARAISSR